MVVLVYRRFFRVKTLSPICNFTPSCSSYAIGMLRRHSAWVAFPHVVRRLRQCNGLTTGVDLLPHHSETQTETSWRAGT